VRGRKPWFAGGVVVLAVLVIARVDLTHTEHQIPPFPPQGESTLPRYEEIRRLDDGFDRRAWAYGGVAAVAMGIAAAVGLWRSSTLEQQRRVFSEAGVAGIVLGVVGVVVLWTLRSNIEPPPGAVFAPCLLLLAVAALGGGAARLQRPPPAEREGVPPEDRGLKHVAFTALLCTAATVVFAYAYAGQQDGSCDTPSTETTWTALSTWAAVVTAIAAVVLGLTGLAARRWFVALICLVVNPAALLYMALSSGALC
jgi:hypothetical protein